VKIRTNFISNSSSTSYIIAIGPESKCPSCGRSDIDIVRLIECAKSYNYEETEIKATGKKEVLDYINDGWYDSETKDKMLLKVREVDDNKDIVLLSISYHNPVLNSIIQNSKNIIILNSQGD